MFIGYDSHIIMNHIIMNHHPVYSTLNESSPEEVDKSDDFKYIHCHTVTVLYTHKTACTTHIFNDLMN